MTDVSELIERFRRAVNDAGAWGYTAPVDLTVEDGSLILAHLQSLTERNAVLEGLEGEVVRIDSAYDIEMYIDTFDDSIADHHIWRSLMEDSHTALTKEGIENG